MNANDIKDLRDVKEVIGDMESKFKETGTEIIKFPKEMQQDILERFVKKYNAQKNKMFQKVWKSQKEFMKIYTPYMDLQKVDAKVDVNK